MMPTSTISISPLREEDIPGAVDAIQEAFAEDPYNLWVYNDRSKLNLNRNRVSLGIRCRWGIRNALFYVAKDLVSDEKDKVLGIAMWIPPRQTKLKKTWGEWLEGWKLWCQQVGMNVWYGRGGLNVKGPIRKVITFAMSLLSFQRHKEKESGGLCSEKSPRRQMRKAGDAILSRVETSRTRRFMKPWAFILSSRWIVMMVEMFASCTAWFESPKVLFETPLARLQHRKGWNEFKSFRKLFRPESL